MNGTKKSEGDNPFVSSQTVKTVDQRTGERDCVAIHLHSASAAANL